MFTGIVEERGQVKGVQKKENLFVLTIAAQKVLRGTKIGDSIAIDGVCLTVTKIKGREFDVDVMVETIRKTTLKYFRPGDRVNLERALKANGRLAGHFVQGHVDGIGTIEKKITRTHYQEYTIAVDKSLSPYLVDKCSVCVDGISLTACEVKGNQFSIYIIPHTLEVTTLERKGKSDKVNIETDILVKYILKMSSIDFCKSNKNSGRQYCRLLSQKSCHISCTDVCRKS